MGSAEPLTILVADLVGEDEPPDWWDAAAHRGRALDGTTDGFAFEFAETTDALSFAKEVERGQSGATDAPPELRIGICLRDEGDAAASLCERASPGQVLVSPAVRSLALGRGGHEFRELGALEADADSATVRAWELLWREPEPRSSIRLCGPLELSIDGGELAPAVPGGQPALLLSYLLANRVQGAHRDELIDALWPHQPPKDPQAALRPILSRLRRAIAPATLEGRERLRIVLPEPVWIDVEEAQRAVATARSSAKGELWESAREQSETAVELLRGQFAPALEGEWVEARRSELEELEFEALEWLARSALALGESELGTAERASRELIARSPYRETGYRFLMEALARGGNVAEALRVYERLRTLLRDELGATPAAELQALHQRLIAGEPAPAASAEETRRVPLPSLLAPRERTAFVGREEELGTLRAAWEHARSGSRRLVLVAGEPGIGKTRLTSELAREAHGEGTVLYAGCSQEALISYQPFVEALGHYARSAQLDLTHATLGDGAGELAQLIPELAASLPAADRASAPDPETRRFLLFEAVSLLLTEAAAQAPVLLVLDDLHWADRATLHLLRHVIRAPRESAVLIVGTYREGEVGADHPLSALFADLRRDGLFERISLDGLDSVGVGELIASHAGHEAPSALVGTVYEQTDGNPFFVEEVMRHLIETGVVFERGGRWASALTADEIGVPEGVKEVLARRLGGLSEGCRAALAQAAVLGREFQFDVLASMAGSDDDALIAELEEAVAAQLVVEVPGRASPAYGFTHALVRETLYGGLSAPRRQKLHARAARAIEESASEVDVAVLAVQYRLAGSAGDPEKAIEYSMRAGASAAERFAWDDAAAHWDGALVVMRRDGDRAEERARLLIALADLMVVVGDIGRQIAYLEEALAVCEELGDAEGTAQAHSRLGMAHSLIDSINAEHLDLGRAFVHFDAAREVLAAGPVRKSLGHLETGVATAFTYGMRIGEGIAAAERGMEIGERLGDDALWAGAAEAYGWNKLAVGDLEEAFTTLDRAFELMDREQRYFLAWMATNICGQFTWGLGDPERARMFFERNLSLPYAGKTSYRQEMADGIGRCHLSMGEAAEARRLVSDARPAWASHALRPLLDLWQGDWAAVDALAARVLETSRRTGNRWDEWASHHFAGRVRYLEGDLDEAAARLEQSIAILVEAQAPYFELWVRPDLARVQAHAGRIDEARLHAERCLEITGNGEDWRGRAGHANLADAVVTAVEGRMADAQPLFAAARETFATYRLRGDEAEALHEWGRALASAGDDGEATDRLEEALEIYRRHDAGEPWLRRVEADLRSVASR